MASGEFTTMAPPCPASLSRSRIGPCSHMAKTRAIGLFEDGRGLFGGHEVDLEAARPHGVADAIHDGRIVIDPAG